MNEIKWKVEDCPTCGTRNWIEKTHNEKYGEVEGYLCYSCDEAFSFLNEWDIEERALLDHPFYFVLGKKSPYAGKDE